MSWSEQHPGPWRYNGGEFPDSENNPILDANGDSVVITDNGVYPPEPETAKAIVRDANGSAAARSTMNQILATIAISEQGFMSKENALKIIGNMAREGLKSLQGEGGAECSSR